MSGGQRVRAGWRWLAGLMAALALLTGCGGDVAPVVAFRTATPFVPPTPYPSATPRGIAVLEPTATAEPETTIPASASAAPTALVAGATVPAATPTLAGEPAPFSPDNAYRHVEELSISVGVRTAGSEGENRAADYIASQFGRLGYEVSRQTFSVTTFQENGSSLALIGVEPRQVQTIAMYYSGAGQIEAPLVFAGYGTPADFANGVARGKIALIERGTEPGTPGKTAARMTFQEKALNARAGGAAAVIIYNDTEGAFQGDLREPFDVPVVSIARSDGLRIRRAVQQQTTVRGTLSVNAVTAIKPSQNVQAVSPAAPGLPIIIVAGHLDTVPTSPGANGNGSGLGILLELARVLAQERRAEMRFVAFGAEEIGLLGSKEYVSRMTEAEKRRVVGVLNLDTVGVGATLNVAGTEDLVARTLALAGQLQLTKVSRMSGDAVNDGNHANFLNAGMRAVFLRRPDDPNYHTAQDRAQFVERKALDETGQLSLKLVQHLLTRPGEQTATTGRP